MALARALSVLFIAIPGFWLGMLIVLAFLFWFGYKTPIIIVQLWQNPWQNLQIVLGPGIVLGLAQGAYIARMSRSCLLEVIGEDFVRTARAKGLREGLVVMRHALPNALLPVITISGVLLGFVLGGSVAVEQAFGVPGLGRALVTAVIERDIIVVQNLVLLYAVDLRVRQRPGRPQLRVARSPHPVRLMGAVRRRARPVLAAQHAVAPSAGSWGC